MKYKDFLNESPYMDDFVESRPDDVIELYNDKSKYQPIDNFTYKHYRFEEYHDEIDKQLYIFKNDKLALVMLYDTQKVDGLGMMYKNYFIQKTKVTISTNDIIDLIMYMIDKKKCDGIVSDRTHSVGGKTFWRKIMKYADDNKFVVGVYNYKTKENIDKSKDESFNTWYTTVVEKTYGHDEKHHSAGLYIKK